MGIARGMTALGMGAGLLRVPFPSVARHPADVECTVG